MSYSALFSLSLLLVTFVVNQPLSAAPPDAPNYLRTSDKVSATGTDDHPYFGWHVNDKDNNEIQSAYQILVASTVEALTEQNTDTWNSGKISSQQQNYIYYAGRSLSSAKRYYWKVRTWDKDGNVSPWSQTSYFDTGLLTNTDWKGSYWIKRETDEANDYTYYRKKVDLSTKKIQRALIYISAFHNYILHLNGKPIGKGAAYHYPQYAYYKAYDVTDAVIEGENSLATLNHWYGGGQGRPKGARGFILKMIVDYADGSQAIFGTDDTWKQQVVSEFITPTKRRNGEGIGYIDVIDSRKQLLNWYSPTLDDSKWSNAKIIGSHPSAPFDGILQPDLTQLYEKPIKPIAIKKLGKNSYVVDLGKIYAGYPRITFSGGLAGDTVQMRGGFVLEANGTVSKKINQSTDLSYQFVLNGGKATFEPIVYLGYRYLQVDNCPIVLTEKNVSFISRHFELTPEKAYFQSSNPMLNQVWQLMQHSLLLGAQESFVDTPTREKGAFLGDAWSQSAVTMSSMRERALTQRVLLEFLDSQDQYWSTEGALNSVYPNVDGKRDIPDYTQQYLVWVWDYYLQTGNLDFLQENYSKLRKVARYVLASQQEKTNLIHNLVGGSGAYKHGIIDWPSTMRYGYDMNTEARTVINAYAYQDMLIMAKIAETTGNTKDIIFFNDKANQIKTAFNKSFLSAQGIYIDGLDADGKPSTHTSQHANMFPLALGMVPQSNLEQTLNKVKSDKMRVGMITVRYLLEALGENQEGQHLLELFTNPQWDGWAQTVSKGGTATWESWDAEKRNESMCHPWGAVGLLGIQRYILGISPLSPQQGRVRIKPLDTNGKLQQVSGIYTTDRGDIRVQIKNRSNYEIEIDIPTNITAQVYIPKGKQQTSSFTQNGKQMTGTVVGDYILVGELGSGKHRIRR